MITFCIPSKNNLRYLKSSVGSIRLNSKYDNKIIVFVDSDTDGTIKWLEENNVQYLVNDSNVPRGIAYGYNRCIEMADTDIVCMFHADMYMGKGFDEAIVKYLKPNTVVSGTRIEPPLHPPGDEKIIHDFGMYPEDFNVTQFDSFIEQVKTQLVNRTTNGIFAPWAMYKSEILAFGMHDETLHSYHEDSDIFNRMVLLGKELIQTWEGLVYHLTCRGGQFQDGVETITSDEKFHKMKNNALRNYLRKWGTMIQNDRYMYPIVKSKYDIAFVVKNCNTELLHYLEPWCSVIHCDADIKKYICLEQPNTPYNLHKRVKSISEVPDNFVVLQFDANNITNDNIQYIYNISDIIASTGNEFGDYQFDIFKLSINSVETFERDNIYI